MSEETAKPTTVEVFREMIGAVIKTVTHDVESMVFRAENGDVFRFYHLQHCCEHVEIADIAGDTTDLIGSPITMAESVGNPDPSIYSDDYGDDYHTQTWTFYKFATAKGYVTVRWIGWSNGMYSEKVDYSVTRAEHREPAA